MASDVEICNLALTHLGYGKEIALLTESSAEARACRRVFSTLRDALLRDHWWPWATKFVTLAMVEQDPNSEWDYSYRYPADCLKFRRILPGSGLRSVAAEDKVPFRLGRDDSGLLIFSDKVDAEGEYTQRVTDTLRYPGDFANALSFRIASAIAPTITGGDPFKNRAQCYQLYDIELQKAKANAANEEQPDEEPASSLERARD